MTHDTAQNDGPTLPIRMAVVGAGWVSREIWLPILQDHDDFKVTVIVDADAVAVSRAAQEFGESTPQTRLGELSREVADAAVVALPNHLHKETAESLMRLGFPVFVEKPVVRSSSEAESLAEVSYDHKQGGAQARLHSWSAARHRTDVTYLRSLLPVIGEFRAVELSWVRAAGIPQRTGWFTDQSMAGGGALLDLGWHLLDVGLDLLGWPVVDQVAGTRSSDWVTRPEAAASWRGCAVAIDRPTQLVEDSVQAMLVTADDVAVRLETRWASHAAEDTTRISVEGVDGKLTLETTFGFSPHRRLPRLTLLRRGREQEIYLPNDPIGTEYRRQVKEFAQVLRGPGRDDRHARTEKEVRTIVEVIERIYAVAGRS